MEYSVSERLPKGYPWKIGTALLQDIEPHITSDSGKAILVDVRHALLQRKVSMLSSLSGEIVAQSTLRTRDLSTHEMSGLYQLCSSIRKFPHSEFKTLAARKDTAYASFFASEERCREATSHLRAGHGMDGQPFTPFMQDVIRHAQYFCSTVMGDEVDLDKVLDGARYGKGQTVSGPDGGRVTATYKISEPEHWTVTPGALPYVKRLLSRDRKLRLLAYRVYCSYGGKRSASSNLWIDDFVTIVPGNRLCTVSKNADTERLMAIEPGLNLMMQLGAEGVLRHGLLRWGINIDDQGKNRMLAELGSVTRDITTLDLKSASDLESCYLIYLLCPRQWTALFADLRSPSGTVNGDEVSYSKISSMGNGYTFALETTIFASIVFGAIRASGGEWDASLTSVFGDDIIIPQQYTAVVIEALETLGLLVNRGKSFAHGVFRESCGVDYHNGVLVRPVFVTDPLQGVDDVNHLINQFQHWLKRWSCTSRRESAVCSLLLGWLPSSCVLFGPPVTSTGTHIHELEKTYIRPTIKWKGILRVPLKFGANRIMYNDPLLGAIYLRTQLSPWLRLVPAYLREKTHSKHARVQHEAVEFLKHNASGSSAGGTMEQCLTRRDAWRHKVVSFEAPAWALHHD